MDYHLEQFTKSDLNDILLNHYSIDIRDYEGNNWTKAEAIDLLNAEIINNGFWLLM